MPRLVHPNRRKPPKANRFPVVLAIRVVTYLIILAVAAILILRFAQKL